MTIYERHAEIERAHETPIGVVSGILATDGEASDGHIIDMDGLEAEAPKPLLFGHNAWDADGTLGSWRSFAKSKHALRGTAAIETEGEGWLADARRDLALMVGKGHIGSFSLRWEAIDEPVRRTNLSKDHPAFVDAQKEKDYRKLWGLYFPRSRVVEGSIVVGKVSESSDEMGFDAQNEAYVDMIKAGIIDPTKVVRTALQDAASVASLLITTEAMVAELPKKDAAPAMPGGGGMGGMDF